MFINAILHAQPWDNANGISKNVYFPIEKPKHSTKFQK